MRDGDFELITLRSGSRAVRHVVHGEVMHPAGGPWQEANRLYVEQPQLAQRLMQQPDAPVRIFDVGLGAATNAVAALTCAKTFGGQLEIHSFELDLAPLRLALRARSWGTHIGRAEHDPFGQMLLHTFAKALDGETSNNEKSFREKTLYLLSTPLRNNDCMIVGAVVLIIDISERKRAEQDRIQLERQYLQIIETANEGIWLIDRNFRTTFANHQMAALLGTTREAMIGADVSQFVFPEDVPSYRARMRERRKGTDGRYETRLRKLDGTECWIQCSAKAIMSNTGQFLGSFGMFTDVSQRRQTEALLRASEKRFRAIIEASTEGILVFSSSSSMIRYANPRACEMLRFSFEELTGFSFLDLFPGTPERPIPIRSFQMHLESTLNTCELRRKDGGSIQVGIKSVMLDLEGEQCQVLFITDLTVRSLLEQERDESAEAGCYRDAGRRNRARL
ncbi:MAG: PAS domain S-box protein [Polyangia bacterium]